MDKNTVETDKVIDLIKGLEFNIKASQNQHNKNLRHIIASMEDEYKDIKRRLEILEKEYVIFKSLNLPKKLEVIGGFHFSSNEKNDS